MKPMNKVTKQSGTGGSSAKISYATGSGSRPNSGTIAIKSTNPSSQQKIRTGK